MIEVLIVTNGGKKNFSWRSNSAHHCPLTLLFLPEDPEGGDTTCVRHQRAQAVRAAVPGRAAATDRATLAAGLPVHHQQLAVPTHRAAQARGSVPAPVHRHLPRRNVGPGDRAHQALRPAPVPPGDGAEL